MIFSQRDLRYIGVLWLAVMAWFHPFFLRGDYLIPPNANSTYPWYKTDAYLEPHQQGSMDAVRENYITWALHDRYIEEGYAPHWQPYFLSGNSLLGNQFAIPYSPYKLLNYLFSAPLAWSLAIILKSFFNGLFTYLSLRALGRGYAAATIGALAWMLSWPLAHQTETTYNEGVAWLPGVFFCLIMTYQAPTWRKQLLYALPAALLAGFQMLAGNIQMTVYSAVLLGGFALLTPLSMFGERLESVGAQYIAPPPPTPQKMPLSLFGEGLGVRLAKFGRVINLRPLWILILVYLGGVLIGAVQLLSSYELLGLSIRGVSQTHLSKGIEPYTALSFFNPWLYFWRNFEFPALRDEYWLNYRWNPYVGLLPLFMLGLALFFVKDRLARGILYLTLGVFAALHLLYLRPIFNLVSQLPGYDAVEQTRLLIVLSFPLAVLAAYGVDWFLEEAQAQWRRLRWLLGAAGGMMGILLLLMLRLMSFFDGEMAAANQLGDSFAEQRTKIGTQLIADYYRLENPLFAATFIIGILGIGLLVAYGRGWLTRSKLEWLMIGLTAVDLVWMAQVNVASTPPEKVYPPTPAIAFLQDKMGEELFRISSAPNTLSTGRPAGEYAAYQSSHGSFMSSTMPPLMPNTPALYGLQDVRGYESVYTLNYSQYMARLEGQAEPFSAFVLPSTITHPMLDALNLRYILALEPLENPALRLVYEGEILIYENPQAVPRVQLYNQFTILEDAAAVLDELSDGDFDPHTQLYFAEKPPFEMPSGDDLSTATTEITHYDPNRVSIQVNTPTDAILVLADVNYPGWGATLDGAKTPVATANYLLRAVYIPAGQHTLEFRYASSIVRYGELISLGSLLLLATLWIGILFSGRLRIRAQ